MYRYVLYQLPHNDKRLFSITPEADETLHLGDYCAVYTDTVDDKFAFGDLETLFEIFNLHHPKNFCGHSLSVSDCIRVIENDQNRIFMCAGIGWKEKNWEAFINA